ncbi:MAG: hypothetical protein KAJ19_18265 [Gammaproteobacteria bacterium]|nr:hypothetical protein [Gammaproteobacteria bacterium]
MMNTKSVLIPLVLLSTTLISFSSPMRTANPPAQGTLETLTINPSAFIPETDDVDHNNYGMMLEVLSGTGGFTAPVYVPPGSYIKSVQLLAEDSDPVDNICISLHLGKPAQFDAVEMGVVCTSGSSGFQTVNTWAINPQYVSKHYIPYFWLDLPASGGLTFYGVKIKYLPPA